MRGGQTIGVEGFAIGGGVAALIPAGHGHGTVGEGRSGQTNNGQQAQKGREDRLMHEGGYLFIHTAPRPQGKGC